MSNVRVDSTRATIQVEPTRPRQTERPPTPFRDVLAGGVDILMAGAEVATSVMGGPVLAAAIREVRHDVGGAGNGAPRDAAPGDTAPGVTGSGGDLANPYAMQRESQAFNLRLLALQEEIQQENRRFTTLSNVMRARHDTAKAAIGNIRG